MSNLPVFEKVNHLNGRGIYKRTRPDGNVSFVVKEGKQYLKHYCRKTEQMIITTFKTQYEAETAAISL